MLPLLNLQLDRSASCPLTLKFSSSDIEAFDLILDHADRLYTVDLWLSDWMMPLLDLKATGRLPLLRSLRFSMSSPLLSCRAFEVAPRLSQVYAYFDNPTLPVPYAQLTGLRHGTPQGLPLVIAPLKLAHNLVELTLVNNDTPSHDVQGTIELSRLCLLRIYRGSFLDQMVLPALENICIYFDPFPLVSLVHRSSCRLRRLIILPSPRDNIVTLLEHIPTLLELHVASDIGTGILSHLTIPHPDSNLRPLCPELRTLHLLRESDADSSPITALAESRHNSASCPPLSLHLHDPRSVELVPSALKTQSTLRGCGIDIAWLTGESAWKQYYKSVLDAYP